VSISTSDSTKGETCVLVLIGATEDGTKELLAVVDGYRESTQSWRELLQQLKRLGLSAGAPKLAIGDGSLGFWIALREEYGPIAKQRCWVHKTANILDKMPKSVQGKANSAWKPKSIGAGSKASN
jgi:transposase-like protein